jgi:hypothetical protein
MVTDVMVTMYTVIVANDYDLPVLPEVMDDIVDCVVEEGVVVTVEDTVEDVCGKYYRCVNTCGFNNKVHSLWTDISCIEIVHLNGRLSYFITSCCSLILTGVEGLPLHCIKQITSVAHQVEEYNTHSTRQRNVCNYSSVFIYKIYHLNPVRNRMVK